MAVAIAADEFVPIGPNGSYGIPLPVVPIAEATFERIDDLRLDDYTFTLTAHAKTQGWDAAFGAGVVRVQVGRFGRGERI